MNYKLQITNYRLKKFLFLFTAITAIFSSCSKSTENEEEFLKSFHPLEFNNKSDLTVFAANQAIKKLSVDKTGINSYTINAEKYSKLQADKTFISVFDLQLSKNHLEISNISNGNTYKLIKNVSTNEILFSANKESLLLSEVILDNLNKNERDILEQLLSIYIELYDVNARRLNAIQTDIQANYSSKAESCLKFESGVGLTASASKLRSVSDTNEYIADGNSDCTIVGSDTSCLTDSHVCVTTTTMSCSSSCSWWN